MLRLERPKILMGTRSSPDIPCLIQSYFCKFLILHVTFSISTVPLVGEKYNLIVSIDEIFQTS